MTSPSSNPLSMTSVPHTSLRALRSALVRDLGDGFATVLQEAGFAGGAAILEAFAGWCGRHGLAAPAALPIETFHLALTRFLAEAGWGRITVTPLGEAVLAIDAEAWAEADPDAPMPYPSCYYTAGMFADLLGRVADAPVGCMEVACRSSGGDQCRFLVGNPEIMAHVYQRITEGAGYQAALDELT
ncbi:MAG: hypothetical protein RL625_1673 [Gemmatimonadota bacterium]